MFERLKLETLLAVAVALYVPHVVDEALTGMHDDPTIVQAFAPLAALSPRHAAYLVFQAMMLLALAMTLSYSRGGKARLLVLAGIGASLVGEGHHLVRALYSLQYNSGLVTSLPMPFFGAVMLRRVFRDWRAPLAHLVSRKPLSS